MKRNVLMYVLLGMLCASVQANSVAAQTSTQEDVLYYPANQGGYTLYVTDAGSLGLTLTAATSEGNVQIDASLGEFVVIDVFSEDDGSSMSVVAKTPADGALSGFEVSFPFLGSLSYLIDVETYGVSFYGSTVSQCDTIENTVTALALEEVLDALTMYHSNMPQLLPLEYVVDILSLITGIVYADCHAYVDARNTTSGNNTVSTVNQGVQQDDDDIRHYNVRPDLSGGTGEVRPEPKFPEHPGPIDELCNWLPYLRDIGSGIACP